MQIIECGGRGHTGRPLPLIWNGMICYLNLRNAAARAWGLRTTDRGPPLDLMNAPPEYVPPHPPRRLTRNFCIQS